MPTDTAAQEKRRAQLAAFASELSRVRDDSDALETMRESGDLAQYAASAYDGNDCWLSLHDTLADAADYLAGEAQGEYPWAPGEVVDLDTGLTWGARCHVELTPTTTQPENRGPGVVTWKGDADDLRKRVIDALRDAHRNDSAADAVEYVSDVVGWSADADEELSDDA